MDRGDGTGEALAGILRPGNAGSNTAGDHAEVVDLALAQLPTAARHQAILVRADTGGATHALVDHLRQQGVRFSVSLPPTSASATPSWPSPATPGPRRSTLTARPARAPRSPSFRPSTSPAAVSTRAICRREDPDPGAQLRFTDADGHRFQAFLTDQDDPDVARLELRHRQRARIEDRIRCGKATGLRNLPFDRFQRNQVWLELVLMACDLVCWAQALLLDGELAVPEPKALRYRCGTSPPGWSATPAGPPGAPAAHLAWAAALARAFARLRALPLRC